jgi:hypothetical protein
MSNEKTEVEVQPEKKIYNRFRLLSGKASRWVGPARTGHFEDHKAGTPSDIMENLTQTELEVFAGRIQPVGRYEFVDDGLPAPPNANNFSEVSKAPQSPSVLNEGKKAKGKPVDPLSGLRDEWNEKLQGTASDVVAEIATIDDPAVLGVIEELEGEGKTRMTIIRAVTKRQEELAEASKED